MNPDTVIDVPFTDARASDLCFALGLDRLDALKTAQLNLGALEVELRILGCSHQVIVESDELMLRASETVACLPADQMAGTDAQTTLPVSHQERWGDVVYAMTSKVLRLSDIQARAPRNPTMGVTAVDELINTTAISRGGLVGLFPGDRHAFTALQVAALPVGGIHWVTYHAYPQADQLVRTTSRLLTPKSTTTTLETPAR